MTLPQAARTFDSPMRNQTTDSPKREMKSRNTLIAVACMAEWLLLSSAHGQSGGCSVDETDGSHVCLANILRVPLESDAVCESEGQKALAERDRLADEARDKQAARVRLIEARMADAEKAIPGDHTNLEEAFTSARAREAETIADDTKLRVSEPPDRCAFNATPLMPLTGKDAVEIVFRAPPRCLQMLQRARGGDLPVMIKRLVSPPDHVAARLTEVDTIIEGDVGMAQARATIARPSIELSDDDQVFVRLQCNDN